MNFSARAAKFFMRLMEREPDNTFGDSNEIFNQKEFIMATTSVQRQIMVDAAQLRYENERLVPFSTYFGKRQLHEYLHGRHVLDFGCSKGGVARSIIEQFAPASLSGVDVEENNLTAARLLFDVNDLPAQFYLYDGNTLPFNNDTFDTIYCFDVFEHVHNLNLSLRECYRVLKPGGHLLAVFPSFYHPIEHHLSLVTLTPFIHYIFGRDALSKAYHAILAERGDKAYWYRRSKAEFESWERSYSINGMTKNDFRKICHETNFSIIYDYPLALFETGRLRRRFPMLGLSVPVFHFLGRFPLVEEVFNHRIVMILRK